MFTSGKQIVKIRFNKSDDEKSDDENDDKKPDVFKVENAEKSQKAKVKFNDNNDDTQINDYK